MRLACSGLSSWFEKATIVTPSRVLAAAAAQQFSRDQLDAGIESWARPAIYTIDMWLENCWHEARYSGSEIPTLLSGSQEQLLWRTLIEQEQPDLFDLTATAHLASRAAKLITQWHIPLESDLWNDHQDAQQFLRWQKLFARKCREENWIARSELWRLVPLWIGKGLCDPGATVFAGFAQTTPAFERVKQALGSLAAFECINALRAHDPVPAKLCSDFNQEIEEAARWARLRFEQESRSSIGVFVPDLSIHRALVERTFQQVFYPSGALAFMRNPSDRDSADCIFHVNAAVPLQSHPLITAALLLLELGRSRIDHPNACAILRCPFIAGATAERSVRALADLELRRKRQLDVSLRDMEAASKYCPLLTPVWFDVRNVLRAQSKYLDLPAWSEFMQHLLEAVGWPGNRKPDSDEQRILELWKKSLSSLAALGLVSTPVSYDAALSQLRRLLSKGEIERGDWLSPIQILDASDASGLEFDSALLTGLSDETWPPRKDPLPLVPLKLQRAHQVPGSSPQSTQRESECATRFLFQVAPVLFATYSGRLSPVVKSSVTPARGEYPQWTGKLPRHSYAPVVAEELEDNYGPPYQENENTRGGVSIIKSQSLCPFRAFAEFRLAAKPPEEACLGFDSRDRGAFVHKALQMVWLNLETQDRLRRATPAELRAIVREAVIQAVRDDDSSPFHLLASQTERERLEELILEWLEFDRRRKQPFKVERVEEKREYETQGLRLRLRVDRVDRLKNGKLLLIDYKSGKQSRKKLECPRPAEPQLLVYASAVGPEVDGLFFGEIKAREVRVVGFSREKHFSESAAQVRKDWDSFLAQSQEEIERIAKEFVEGYAAVDPVHNACDYCNVKPLCRINENVAMEREEE